MATNPVVSLPDSDAVRRALRRCEFVVVSDVVQENDTLRFAHIKLPALAWGEKEGTVTNSERRISRQRAFIAPPAEARPDWWMLARVAQRLGFDEAFAYGSAAAIFREHAALSECENGGTRAFDIGALADLSDAAYDTLAPVQWPVARGRQAASTRLFGDGRFFTPDGRARLQPVVPQLPAEAEGDGACTLNTGRVRDQWHTMTRTGLSPRLSRHLPEPFLSLHPEDAARFGLVAGAFATVTSACGEAVLRVTLDSGLRRGEVFAPMHWSDTLTDPVSGQPQSKHTRVRIAPWHPAWQGLLVTRVAPPTLPIAYWTRSRGKDAWFTYIADSRELAPEHIRRWLGADAEADLSEYRDPRTASHRCIRMRDTRVEAALFVSRSLALPERDWLEQMFACEELDAASRLALLAGRPVSGATETGRIICACHGVGENAIRAAVAAGADSLEAIGRCLHAGTGCGACTPELRRFLA
jgi:assimilatory nitrate reductase catalytic subunit